jgi:hypothetical protein
MTNTIVPRISTLVLLTTVLFLMLYQTNIAQFMIRALISSIPPFIGRGEVIFCIMFAAFAAIVGGTYTFGGKSKVTLLTVCSSIVFAFIALPFSLNNWISEQINSNVIDGLPFFFAVLGGIIVLFCLISLSLISKLEYTEKELIARGAQKQELETITSKSISYILPVTILSMLLTIAAIIIVMVARPLGMLIVEISPYMILIIGITSIATITLLIYYTLKQDHQH